MQRKYGVDVFILDLTTDLSVVYHLKATTRKQAFPRVLSVKVLN